jgi:Tol biopolymer transport system component
VTLTAGSRLGPYEILAPLGAGGMGEVWRARDTKLGRDVALKVLPQAVALDSERLARFEREAQVLASLNHPHVAAIYGVEDSTPTKALVLELVEGPTLQDRIAQGALPVEEAIAIARQIAEGLEAAHEKGIVHRDLKPANVKVSTEGEVKVLDFGLAKAVDLETGGKSDLAHSPTLTGMATQLGVVLGTAAYMAPEQARGGAVDKRADVWAFGAVLYEMLTGRRLFEGDTATDVLAAVLRQDIPWTQLPAATPPGVRHLLERCLVRDRKQRLHDIADARLELEAAATGSLAAGPAAEKRRGALLWPVLTGASLIAAAAALLWGVAARRDRPVREPQPMTLSVTLPADATLESTGGSAGPVVVSPSGRQIAFCASRGAGVPQLWVRRLDEADAHPIAGTEGANHPFWAPDEKSLGYFSDLHLRRIAVDGGPVTTLAEAADPRGGTWGPDGTILFTPNYVGAILRVPADGGESRPATRIDSAAGEETHRYPQFLPDGRHFLFLSRAGWKGTVRLGSLDAEETRPVANDTANALYSAGHLLYTHDGALVAQPFDLATSKTTGPARPLVDRLLYDERYSLGIFSASPGGVLAYQTGTEVRLSQFAWLDRSGHRLSIAGEKARATGSDCPPALSPDASRVLTCRPNDAGTSSDVWLLDLKRGTSTALTNTEADETLPIWSADGGALLYGSYATASDPARVSIRRRGEDAVALLEDKESTSLRPQSMSPDGRLLVVLRENPQDGSGSLLLLELGASPATAQPLPVGKGNIFEAKISPDGRWLAYVSVESGRNELYLMRFPDGGGVLRVSRGGALRPRWRDDGREIYFLDAENWLVASQIESDSSREVATGRQTRLFQMVGEYAVTGDGQRFLVEERLSEGDVSPITIRTGWETAPAGGPR